MPKVDCICQVIIRYFRLKARPWQISIFGKIIHKKKDCVCAIISINASKNLVYEAILVITRGLILVILITIILINVLPPNIVSKLDFNKVSITQSGT